MRKLTLNEYRKSMKWHYSRYCDVKFTERVLVFLSQGSAGSFPRRQRVSISVCPSHVTGADLHGRKKATTDISFKLSALKIQTGVPDRSLTTHTARELIINPEGKNFFFFNLCATNWQISSQPTEIMDHRLNKTVDCHKPTKYKYNKDMQSAVNEHRSSALCTMFFTATNAFGIIHKLNVYVHLKALH